MTQEEKIEIEERIVDVLKTVYDPEIPVNIWDLGMIYKVDVKDDFSVHLDMTESKVSMSIWCLNRNGIRV